MNRTMGPQAYRAQSRSLRAFDRFCFFSRPCSFLFFFYPAGGVFYFCFFIRAHQKCLAELVALQGRKGSLPLLSERLLSFIFTQASTAEREEGEEDEEEAERKAGEGADSASGGSSSF